MPRCIKQIHGNIINYFLFLGPLIKILNKSWTFFGRSIHNNSGRFPFSKRRNIKELFWYSWLHKIVRESDEVWKFELAPAGCGALAMVQFKTINFSLNRNVQYLSSHSFSDKSKFRINKCSVHVLVHSVRFAQFFKGIECDKM